MKSGLELFRVALRASPVGGEAPTPIEVAATALAAGYNVSPHVAHAVLLALYEGTGWPDAADVNFRAELERRVCDDRGALAAAHVLPKSIVRWVPTLLALRVFSLGAAASAGSGSFFTDMRAALAQREHAAGGRRDVIRGVKAVNVAHSSTPPFLYKPLVNTVFAMFRPTIQLDPSAHALAAGRIGPRRANIGPTIALLDQFFGAVAAGAYSSAIVLLRGLELQSISLGGWPYVEGIYRDAMSLGAMTSAHYIVADAAARALHAIVERRAACAVLHLPCAGPCAHALASILVLANTYGSAWPFGVVRVSDAVFSAEGTTVVLNRGVEQHIRVEFGARELIAHDVYGAHLSRGDVVLGMNAFAHAGVARNLVFAATSRGAACAIVGCCTMGRKHWDRSVIFTDAERGVPRGCTCVAWPEKHEAHYHGADAWAVVPPKW